MPAAIAPSILAASRFSNTSKSPFCSAIGSASSRFRNVVIGGSSSRKDPSRSASSSPVAASARRDIDCEITPLARGDLGQAPLHERFASRDDLHHRGVPGREILLNGADQGRRLHGRNEVIEEALLVRLE